MAHRTPRPSGNLAGDSGIPAGDWGSSRRTHKPRPEAVLARNPIQRGGPTSKPGNPEQQPSSGPRKAIDMDTFLPRIDKPRNPIMRMVYAMDRRTTGKVTAPISVFAAQNRRRHAVISRRRRPHHDRRPPSASIMIRDRQSRPPSEICGTPRLPRIARAANGCGRYRTDVQSWHAANSDPPTAPVPTDLHTVRR